VSFYVSTGTFVLIETKVLHFYKNVTNLQGYHTPLIETKVLHLYKNVTNLQGYYTLLIETKVLHLYKNITNMQGYYTPLHFYKDVKLLFLSMVYSNPAD
jgi:hypothetical protein